MQWIAPMLCLLLACASGGAQDVAPASRPAALTIATYNVNFGNKDLPLLIRTIRGADADVVCLQEINPDSERQIRLALREAYPHMVFRPAEGGGGFGVLSRLPFPRQPEYLEAEHGMFGTFFAYVLVGGQEVQLVNVHLMPVLPPRRNASVADLAREWSATEKVRAREARRLFQFIRRDGPVLILGDFNSAITLSAPAFFRARGFADSFGSVAEEPDRQVTWHWNYNGIEWRFRIDHILHSPHFATRASRIVHSDASDHYLLVSELAWDAPASQPASAPAADVAGADDGDQYQSALGK